MSCRKLSDLQLWAYLDGELPMVERAAAERHLAGCASCAARLATLRRPLFEPIMAVPSPSFHHQVMARVALTGRGDLPAPDLGWLGPLLHPRRLALASTAALTVALLSVALVGAALAVPAVEAAMPAIDAPAANSMVLAMRWALLPLRPFFHQWGPFVLVLGMFVAVLMPAVRALALRLHERS